MRFTILLIVLLSTCVVKAQSWCSKEYNPKINLAGADKSPDFKKQYTAYFYFKQKAGRTTFFTPIYKLTFINYNNNKQVLGFSFFDKLKEFSLKYIKEKHPNTFIPYSASVNGGYCLSLEDLKKERQREIDLVKKRNNKLIITDDIAPDTFSFKASGKFSKNQELTFKIVE